MEQIEIMKNVITQIIGEAPSIKDLSVIFELSEQAVRNAQLKVQKVAMPIGRQKILKLED